MKIIKQNDSAGGLIFKQNTNGKAMKQNYIFGRGLLDPVNRIELDLQQYDKSNGLSLLFFSKAPLLVSGGANFLRIYTNLYYYSLRSATYMSAVIRKYFLNNSYIGSEGAYNPTLVMFPPSPYVGLLYIYLSSDFKTLKIYYNTTNEIHEITANSSIDSEEILDKLNFTGISHITDLAIFERELNVIELNYKFNNRLGNPFLSEFKLASLFNLNNASIINNSFVGIVDQIKTGGMPLSSLPAGTLSEQLAYANDNFFAPF